MDTLIVIIALLYVLFESFCALEAMPRISLLRFFHEFANPYTLKYWACGMYSLFGLYHADKFQGWYAIIIVPPLLCVAGRFTYRIRNSKWYQHN